MDVIRDYQHRGVGWIVDRFNEPQHAVMLADAMGLGKTLQAILAASRLNAKRICIVCPAGARQVWAHEIAKWMPGWSQRVLVIEPGHNNQNRLETVQRRLGSNDPLILIISYDELSNTSSQISPQLPRRRWHLLICDEAHYLKNSSNRTHAVYGRRGHEQGLHHSAERVLLLTGTPTPNHAGELYHHIRALWPYALFPPSPTPGARPMHEYEFMDYYTRWRDSPWGRQITGSRNQGELRDKLSGVVLRRRKRDVLKELPPLILQDIPISGGSLGPLAAAKSAWVKQYQDDDDALIDALRHDSESLSTLRREIGERKAKGAAAWIAERLESTRKILVFAWHRSVIEILRANLMSFGPVVITGETPPRSRQQAIDAFQTDASTRVFIGQILAAGTAITLTAASEVAIVEPSWVPGENAQAICRAHRLGQHDAVLASFLYMPDSLDQAIMAAFRRKAAEIQYLEGDDHGTNDPDYRHDAA